jgi:hypothetical protein
MYAITTSSEGWINRSSTKIRVEFDDDAKAEADQWSGPCENMLEKCVWRLLFERRDEVLGEFVRFKVTRDEVLGLIERLRIANNEIVT